MTARLRGPLANLALAAASGALALLLAEGLARAAGARPYVPTIPDIRVEPGGRLSLPHSELGYTYAPGRFRVTFDTGDGWTTTHLPDTLRVTRPPASYARPWSGPSLWLFGCSFVHGWGLDDHETLGWMLHERLPGHDVVNFGVGGYNTVQALLQLRRALRERPRPAFVVLAYAGFHDERNTALRSWRRGTYEYEGLGTTAAPYARLGADDRLELRFERPRYRGFELLTRLAVAELADRAYMRLEERLARSHRVSEQLVETMSAEAAAAGVRFVLAGVSEEPGTRAMLEHARARGILAVDVAQTLKGRNRIRWDGHPSGRANRLSADRLVEYLAGLPAEDPTSATRR